MLHTGSLPTTFTGRDFYSAAWMHFVIQSAVSIGFRVWTNGHQYMTFAIFRFNAHMCVTLHGIPVVFVIFRVSARLPGFSRSKIPTDMTPYRHDVPFRTVLDQPSRRAYTNFTKKGIKSLSVNSDCATLSTVTKRCHLQPAFIPAQLNCAQRHSGTPTHTALQKLELPTGWLFPHRSQAGFPLPGWFMALGPYRPTYIATPHPLGFPIWLAVANLKAYPQCLGSNHGFPALWRGEAHICVPCGDPDDGIVLVSSRSTCLVPREYAA